MRFEKKNIYRGVFWFTTNSIFRDRKFGGTLTIDKDGSISLELELQELSAMMNIDRQSISRIDGYIKKDNEKESSRFVTLLDCLPHTQSDRRGFSTITILPKFCIQSMETLRSNKSALRDGEEKFDKIFVCLDGVMMFSEMNGFSKDYDSPQNGFDFLKKYKIEWNKPKTLYFRNSNPVIKIKLLLDYDNKHGNKFTLEQRAWLVLDFSEQTDIVDCARTVENLKYFFGFLFNRQISITAVFGKVKGKKLSEPEAQTDLLPKYSIFYKSNAWEQEFDNNHYPDIRYSNFQDDNNENHFAKYLVSFLEKMEDQNDDNFSTVFFSYIHRIQEGFLDDYSKQAIDLCEYLFVLFNQNYPCPDREKIEDLRKKIKILAKPLIGCLFKDETEVEHFAYAANKYRGEVTHFNNPPVYSDLKENIFWKITVLTRFHLLDALHPDHKFNIELLEEAWLLMMDAKEGYRTKRDFPKRYKEYFETNPNH